MRTRVKRWLVAASGSDAARDAAWIERFASRVLQVRPDCSHEQAWAWAMASRDAVAGPVRPEDAAALFMLEKHLDGVPDDNNDRH